MTSDQLTKEEYETRMHDRKQMDRIWWNLVMEVVKERNMKWQESS